MAATRDIEGVWFREDAGKGGPSQPLRIGAPKAESDTVVVSFDGRTAHMSLCRDAKASVDVSSCTGVVLNWGHLGHSDWGQAHFLFDGSNAQVLIEKGHHIWRKSPPSFLSFEQLKTFRKNGYLVLRGAVCKDLVQRARRAILADMQATYSPGEFPRMSAQSFAPNLRAHDGGILSNLLNRSSVLPAVTSLIGRVHEPSIQGPPQVAIRFPSDPRSDFKPPSQSGAHIDGVPTATNGVTEFSPFTALVGVALSDQEQNFAGNLIVHPGSHVLVATAFRHNLKAHDQQPSCSTHGGGSAAGNGSPVGNSSAPPKSKRTRLFGKANSKLYPDGVLDHPEARPPVHLHMKAGDAVIAHYLLVHGVAENRSDALRINAYWRVRHVDHVHRSTAHSKTETSPGTEEPGLAFVTAEWSGFDSLTATPEQSSCRGEL